MRSCTMPLSSLKSVARRPAAGVESQRRVPRAEPLEGRLLFAGTSAAAASADLRSGMLRVRGTNGADAIELSLAGAGDAAAVNVVVNGATIGTFAANAVTRGLQVDGRAGDDLIRLGAANDAD